MRLTDQHREQLNRIKRGQLRLVEFGTRRGDLVREMWLAGLVVGNYWSTPPERGARFPDPEEMAAGLVGLRQAKPADRIAQPDYRAGAQTTGSS